MTSSPKPNHPILVELANGVCVETTIPPGQHSALRSGFAGYPPNPRWTAPKVVAWKTGRQWRDALARGEMMVRESDSRLLAIDFAIDDGHDHPSSSASGQPSPLPKPAGAFCFLWNSLIRKDSPGQSKP